MLFEVTFRGESIPAQNEDCESTLRKDLLMASMNRYSKNCFNMHMGTRLLLEDRLEKL